MRLAAPARCFLTSLTSPCSFWKMASAETDALVPVRRFQSERRVRLTPKKNPAASRAFPTFTVPPYTSSRDVTDKRIGKRGRSGATTLRKAINSKALQNGHREVIISLRDGISLPVTGSPHKGTRSPGSPRVRGFSFCLSCKEAPTEADA